MIIMVMAIMQKRIRHPLFYLHLYRFHNNANFKTNVCMLVLKWDEPSEVISLSNLSGLIAILQFFYFLFLMIKLPVKSRILKRTLSKVCSSNLYIDTSSFNKALFFLFIP
jgi:hypothetical protein